jgi:glycosyltransferase involved in cell wall biosynthesis
MAEPVFPADLKVALVHDWLTGMRGGEKCLEVFCEIFPRADIFTLLHVPGSVSETISSHPIYTSFIQRLPAAAKTYRWALPLFPAAIERFDFQEYDLVLSSSHSVAKGARVPADALSVCYCYTPMRYIWDRFDDYFGGKSWPMRQAIGAVAAGLRQWDRRSASRVQLWLAISNFVKQRILNFYGADPQHVDVIFPPVDTTIFNREAASEPPAGLASRSYDLVISALVPYKRVDLAVRAALQTGRHLVVVGGGPETARLKKLASELRGPGRVTFIADAPTADLPSFYAHCRSFVFPGLEDFGITPLEATACGRPVVAYRAGGALDTVQEGLNGIFFAEQSVPALSEALADPRLDRDWDTEAMAVHARGFSRDRFKREITDRLGEAWRQYRSG